MLDIKLIRENPEKINELLKRRNPELSIDTIIAIDADRRKVQAQADELRAKRKSESQKIGMLKKSGENTDAIQEEVRKLGDEINIGITDTFIVDKKWNWYGSMDIIFNYAPEITI